MSLITIEIWFNGNVIRANLVTEDAAARWAAETLAALLADRPPQVGDQIEIRRVS